MPGLSMNILNRKGLDAQAFDAQGALSHSCLLQADERGWKIVRAIAPVIR